MGELGSILGWGRSPGRGHDNPLQYSCLENPMDRGAWCAAAESDKTEATKHAHTAHPSNYSSTVTATTLVQVTGWH